METIHIAFYKGKKRLFNKLTAWWTQGEYSHCELIESFIEGDLAVCHSSSFMDGGVREKLINLEKDKWDIVSIPVCDGTKATAIEWFKKHQGDKYDLLGLLGFIWTPTRHSIDKWFCSEAVAEAISFEESWRQHPNMLAAVTKSIARKVK